jgi:hypothetical protein
VREVHLGAVAGREDDGLAVFRERLREVGARGGSEAEALSELDARSAMRRADEDELRP